ncbi:hypothetical protein FB45DRAFT_353578 [Roridomyces roridus]|uniref:DUF3533 domain-containing protein n=1 Tax=Roridomyces roridus TaxID=1738132 RepID=A0AAD7C974_9AGAR|nr:hypothetical protein FB45DRAFT_353578 [Roridomyces roridus]
MSAFYENRPNRASFDDAASEATTHDGATSTSKSAPFSSHFFEKSAEASAARGVYLKTIVGGVVALSVVIFTVFSIYWGSVWSSPHHTLPGWIVDFDGGAVGQTVSQALSNIDPGKNVISWAVVSASQFPEGIAQLEDAILQEKTWYAVAINSGASTNLTTAVSAVDGSYNSSKAITFIASEARNENIYRVHKTIATAQLDAITHQFALHFIADLPTATNAATLLSSAPELVARPIYYSVANLRPFDVPVASAVTFVGLIYLAILSFFVVMLAAAAREASGFEARLSLGSIIRLRLTTSAVAYFFIALIYTLLSRAFQLPFDRRFGSAGFVIFWMLNWLGMLACGLALEAMLTLLTQRFVPFFLMLWIISNVSTSVFLIPVLPHVYRYGYVFPFYNVSRAIRAIIFETKNDLGLNFGVLIAWVALSCGTMAAFQWFVRRRAVEAGSKTAEV